MDVFQVALGLSFWDGETGVSLAALSGPFGDEETRSFYEDVPDLLNLLPTTLLGLTEEEVIRMRQEANEQKQREEEEMEVSDEVSKQECLRETPLMGSDLQA